MGLYKVEELANGVTVSYHRIATLTHEVNWSTMIYVRSYTSKEKRDQEPDPGMTPFGSPEIWTWTEVFNPGYSPEMDVVDAYEWLKQQERFAGATDVFEEDPQEEVPEGSE